MPLSPTLLERAFELARSGTCLTLIEIRTKLRAEGFSLSEIGNQIYGKSLSRQLQALIDAAREPRPEHDEGAN
jgi:hypothetical protein